MKKLNMVCLILYGLCAVIWSVNASYDIYRIFAQTFDHSDLRAYGNAVCAVLWITAFVFQWRKVRSMKDK